MNCEFYIVVHSKGAVKCYKHKPPVRYDEIAVGCQLSLPDSLFRKPQITASIVVTDENTTSFKIDAVMLNDIKESIEATSGLNVMLQVINPE